MSKKTLLNSILILGVICLIWLPKLALAVGVPVGATVTCPDGICAIQGCTNVAANNYDSTATYDDGTCEFDVPPQQTRGCTDPTATNYNPEASLDDGSCRYVIRGCTNPLAVNYNPLATIDDGSCRYTIPNVSGFSANYENEARRIHLTWSNPSFHLFAGVRLVKSNSVPSGPDNGVIIYEGSGQSFNDSNISYSTIYYYAIFVRSSAGGYSSGAVTSVQVPDQGGEEPLITPPGDFPGFSLVSKEELLEIFKNLDIGQFILTQSGEPRKILSNGSFVRINGYKNLTISLAYDKVPEVLKTIGMTISNPDDPNQTFSFILRADTAKTVYEATIAPLYGEGVYPIAAYVINYDDQTVARIRGQLVVAGVAFINERVTGAVANKIVSPVLSVGGAVAGVTGVIVASGGIASLTDIYLLFLRGLGALLGWLGLRKKRRDWGTVYDAVTKRPIDPAYVTVKEESGKEVGSAITDIDGRFGFFLQPGTYRLEAGKTHYHFPSQTLRGKKTDELYSDLYFGEEFQTIGEEVITKNIPLDPIGFDWNEFVKGQTNYFKIFSKKKIVYTRIISTIYGLGLVFTLGGAAFAPSWLNISLLALYAAIFLFEHYWQSRHRAVTILKNGLPMPFAVIRLYVTGVDQLVKSVVADQLGHFYTLLRPGEYYLTVDEKLPDGSYRQIYKSETLNLKTGVLREDIKIA